MILLCFVIMASYFTYTFQYKEYLLHSDVVINVPAVGYVSLSVFTALSIIYKAFYQKEAIRNIWNFVIRIENMYHIQYNQFMDFKPFYHVYLHDVAMVSSCHLIHTGVRVIFNYGFYDLMVKSSTLSLITVVFIADLHIVFYVRLLEHLFKRFNARIQCSNAKDMESTVYSISVWKHHASMNTVKFIKQAHYLLWNISNMINRHFGWIVVFFLLLSAYEAVHTAFWIIWYIDHNSEPDSHIEQAKLFSKYIFGITYLFIRITII